MSPLDDETVKKARAEMKALSELDAKERSAARGDPISIWPNGHLTPEKAVEAIERVAWRQNGLVPFDPVELRAKWLDIVRQVANAAYNQGLEAAERSENT